MTDKKEKLLSSGMELVQFYRNNPIIALEDLLNIELDIPQRVVFRSLWFKGYVLVTAGRGVGKSFMNAALACLWCLLYPGQRAGLLAPSFRQSKVMFAEVEKIYNKAPILREACVKPPTKQSDRCTLLFRHTDSTIASVIEAVPLGTGEKIRGARYFLIIADEFAQLPYEIFTNVILPMGATSADPMENVKRIARQNELIERGLATSTDFKETTNKVILSSSAYYQFNHMYARMMQYQELIKSGDPNYAVHVVPYHHMSQGFLKEDNIKEAKATSTEDEFKMEYGAVWISDSSGIFKASVIEKCRQNASHTVSLVGTAGKDYILGVDPARTRDAFALTLVELGDPSKVKCCWEYFKQDFPTMASIIMEICDNFNVVGINMDAGGGGTAIMDLLQEKDRFGSKVIIDANDPDKEYDEGRRILHMVNFSSKTISEMNYAALNLMEKGSMTFPKGPQFYLGSTVSSTNLGALEAIHNTVEKMLAQLLSIEVTETRSGTTHFDVPGGNAHAKMKKDLYTSFILASKLVYDRTLGVDDLGSVLQLGIVSPLNSPYSQMYNSKTSDDYDNGVVQAPIKGWDFRNSFK